MVTFCVQSQFLKCGNDCISYELVLLILDSNDDGIAQGNDALTMLDYPQSRNAYIDEILEVCTIVNFNKFSIV